MMVLVEQLTNLHTLLLITETKLTQLVHQANIPILIALNCIIIL